MKQDTPSETALRIAGNKVASALDPVLRPLLADPDEPYSERFIRAHSPRARFLLGLWKFGPTRRFLMRMGDAAMPGGALHILLRKRYVRETLSAALADPEQPVEQVVIFGAGLDPLALRLQPDFPHARFYEIDHPATQAVKRRALERGDGVPPGVTLIPVDFAHESAAERLLAAPGFRPDARTFFLAEGLLMYLKQAEVDALFELVARNGAPGSLFLFTMVDSAALADPDSPVSRMARLLEQSGEPMHSFIERKRLDGFLRKHGFKRRSLIDHQTLATTYLKPRGLDLPLIEGELILLAQAL